MSDLTVRPEWLVARLFEACQNAGGQGNFARQHGIPQSILSEVLSGKRDVPETIANALGYVRTVVFRKITKQRTA